MAMAIQSLRFFFFGVSQPVHRLTFALLLLVLCRLGPSITQVHLEQEPQTGENAECAQSDRKMQGISVSHKLVGVR